MNTSLRQKALATTASQHQGSEGDTVPMRTVIASSPDLVWGRHADRPARRRRPGLVARLTARRTAPVRSITPEPRHVAAPVTPAA
ncbi:MAG TPA: hypothetical protein VLK34_08900 [Nocardioidaceae bacterium]|nr:hypothetical protein [Nocardioidaceae bacterium]